MAPSGDNCQPWQFALADKAVKIYNLPEKDKSLYNYKQRASFVAHGALLENLAIAAKSLGLEPKASCFPDAEETDLTAVVEFSESDIPESRLAAYIAKRHTDREQFRPAEISATLRQALLNAAADFPDINLWLSQTATEKDGIASVICNNDRIVFETESLHNFLFEQIRWNSHEVTETKDGLDINTLGLNALDKSGFKFLQHWALVKQLNHLGLSRIIGKKAEKTFKSAAAIGMISIPGSAPENYIAGGRAMERIWLEVTRAGLSFHPIAGIAFLMQMLKEKAAAGRLNERNQALLYQTFVDLEKKINRPEDTILMFFRIGPAKTPAVRSLRYALPRVMRS
jgi:hypothetical protein